MELLANLSKAARTALENAFAEQSGFHELDLQKPNEGEGFYLVSTHEAYVRWLTTEPVETNVVEACDLQPGMRIVPPDATSSKEVDHVILGISRVRVEFTDTTFETYPINRKFNLV